MIYQTLSHYKIIEKLGAGGMGEVYRAEDTKLKRQVALKILPEVFAGDPERLARFQREAEVLASLNHPNIGSIYGLEEADGKRFLVLELVEGETLAERIRKGPLPVDESLAVCRQIAEGLESAHEKGIIHRDLKPANVKITPESKVKLLDFGLARAFTAEIPASDLSQSPTLTGTATQMGVIIGTASYMSPEQARGKVVDKRSDIWAFGCVLYECLTGKRAFEGETVTDVLAGVVSKEPDWSALPADTPFRIRDLLHLCFRKDTRLRLRDIGDARIAFEDPQCESLPTPVVSSWRISQAFPWIALALMVVFVFWRPWVNSDRTVVQPSASRLAITLPAEAGLWHSYIFPPGVALSPDGADLVYVGGFGESRQLYRRSIRDYEISAIPGTEEARYPFFSPDGEWVAFLTLTELKKVSIRSGALLSLCEAIPVSSAGCWGGDGYIYFTFYPDGGIVRVPADGGELETITVPDASRGERGHQFPHLLPHNSTILFAIRKSGGWSDTDLGLLSLETGQWDVLLEGGDFPRYLPSGHLVYTHLGAILAIPLNLDDLQLNGFPSRVVEGVTVMRGAALDISQTGLLAYVPGSGGWPRNSLAWVDRNGRVDLLAFGGRNFFNPRIAASGEGILVNVVDEESGNVDVWLAESGRLTRITTNPAVDVYPIWNPAGDSITFGSAISNGAPQLVTRSLGGEDKDRVLLEMDDAQFPTSWSPDGRTLLFTHEDPKSGYDIYRLSVDSAEQPQPIVQTEYSETAAAFSPDGKWVAYQSNESGQFEVYVIPFGFTGPRRQISMDGGREPVWSQKGDELFFRAADKMMAVPVTLGSGFSAGEPRLLFSGFDILSSVSANYDYDASNEKFLMIQPDPKSATQINIVLNWFEELKRLCPTGN